MFASSSNGRTADSDSVNLGSNPGEAANKKSPTWGIFYWLKSTVDERTERQPVKRILQVALTELKLVLRLPTKLTEQEPKIPHMGDFLLAIYLS